MARPKKTLNAEQIKEVQTLAAVLNQSQIADYFGFSQDTFQRLMKKNPEVLRSYQLGRAKAIASIAGNLIKSANNGNVSAMTFYLKTQAGWKESQDINLSSADGISVKIIDA